MASLAGISGLPLPKFGANMDPADGAAIRNYCYQLQEQLNYVLTNLDTSNFSPDMQQSYTGVSRAAYTPASDTTGTQALAEAARASREAAAAGRKK